MPETKKYPVGELRRKLGFTKQQLAERLGVSPRTVDGWESSHMKRNPSKMAIKFIESILK